MDDVLEKTYCHATLVTAGESRAKLWARVRRGESWKAIHETTGGIRRGFSDPKDLWDKLTRDGICFLFPDEPEYPAPLREIPDPPLGIYVRGTLPHPDSLAIAIVGTRRATPTGLSLAKTFGAGLASRGIAVVSGLAFGVDAAAHEGCLDAGGTTVAVLPCGLDRAYPRSHDRLAKKIIERGGALVSEYPPGTEPLPYRFLERNRIVSGLSRGIIVVEAPEGSGSIATARFAGEQGRDVFVVPGPATHPNYAASHDLIRSGAELVTKPEHVFEAYGLIETETKNVKIERAIADLSPDEKTVLLFLREHGQSADVDKIIERTKLQPQAVNATLSFLLIKEFVKETADGYAAN